MQYISFVHNGKFVLKENLNLGLNRGFRYGDGLFESLRIINGTPHLYEPHLKRLFNGLKKLKIQLTAIQEKQLMRRVPELIEKNKIDGDGILRIFVYRSGGGKYSPEENAADYLLEAEPLNENGFKMNETGLRIDLSEGYLIQPTHLTEVKSLNALPYVLASVEKQERGLDDLLLLNEKGNIVEATSSNIFLCFKNELHTPLISDGCLPGIMRNHILKIASKQGYKVVERSMNVKDVLTADECFLSNSISGIRWVVAFQNKRYFNKFGKQIFGLL